MGTKFIRNTDDATIVCKIPSDKNKVFIFRPKKFDKRNNVLLSNGYTEVSDEDIALLAKESNTYQYYTKLGKLTDADSLPHESMSPDQLIAALKTEIAVLKKAAKGVATSDDSSELKAEIVVLKKALAENSTAELKAAEDVIKALNETIIELTKEVQDHQDVIDGLNKMIAEISAEKAAE